MAIDINIPSQVKTYANLAGFPATGSLKTIFIAEDTNKTYRWTGSAYVEVSAAGATGITIGTTAITSGTVGRVLFEGTGNVVQESANLFWDNTNGRLGIGTSSPAYKLSVAGSIDAGANFIGYGLYNQGIFPQGPSGELRFVNGSGGGWFYTWVQNGSERMRLTTGNNLLINTTTDAGFKLDVNGTVRSQGNLFFGTAGSYLLGDTNNIRLIDKNGQTILQSFPTGVNNSETYLRCANSTISFLRLRDDYMSLEWANSTISSTAQNPIQITRGYFGNVGATDKSVLYVKSTALSNLSNATTLRGIFIDINDTTTFTGFTTVRAIEAPRGGAYFNTTSPQASAVLQADSTTQGFLPPRGTNAQMLAIASPATGLIFFDTTNNKLNCYDGTTWQPCW